MFSDLATLCCGSCPHHQCSIPPAREKRRIRCREKKGNSLLEWQMQRHLPFRLSHRKRRPTLQCYHQDILRLGPYQTGILTEFQPSFLLLIKSFQLLFLACFDCSSFVALFPPKGCRHPIPLMFKVLIDPLYYDFRQFLQVLVSVVSLYFVVLPLLLMETKLMGTFSRSLPQRHLLSLTRSVSKTLQNSCQLCASFICQIFLSQTKIFNVFLDTIFDVLLWSCKIATFNIYRFMS